MQKEPLISAIILTYNQQEFIGHTIECALEQKTEYNYEIIIGEDCSTDDTGDIVYRYQKMYPSKIRVITSDQNVGLLDNYCRSVKAARGKYIAGCGGDDYWHNPDKLQMQGKFLEEHPEYGMVHSDENALFEAKGELIKNYNQKSRYSYDNKSDDTLGLLFAGNYHVVASSSVYRKLYFDQYFNISELKTQQIVMEDMPLWLIIAAHSKIYYMSESLVTRRVVKGSITRQGFDKKMELWQSVYNCYLFYYNKYRNSKPEMKVDINTIHYLLNHLMLKTAFKANRKKLVRRYYLNIVNLAGKSFVKAGDRLRYYVTYLPLGIKISSYLFHIYLQWHEALTGIPRRDF
ncbi:glycosyltransferase family 2 protein [Planctomycetota bacterium]